MFLCLFSGVELMVRDAQGGVSVYNVETNKHRVLLTSSSFVSANLLVSTEHNTVFADWRQMHKAIRFSFFIIFPARDCVSTFYCVDCFWIENKIKHQVGSSRRIDGSCQTSAERPIDSDGFCVIPKRLTGILSLRYETKTRHEACASVILKSFVLFCRQFMTTGSEQTGQFKSNNSKYGFSYYI